MEQVHLGTKVASGGSGQIFAGSYAGRPVALKELYAQKMDSEDIAEFKSVTLQPISCLSPSHTHNVKVVIFEYCHSAFSLYPWKLFDQCLSVSFLLATSCLLQSIIMAPCC